MVQVIKNLTKQDKNRTKWANNKVHGIRQLKQNWEGKQGKKERGGTSKRKDINGNNLYFVKCVNRSH